MSSLTSFNCKDSLALSSTKLLLLLVNSSTVIKRAFPASIFFSNSVDFSKF